jgi:hypothetical protein
MKNMSLPAFSGRVFPRIPRFISHLRYPCSRSARLTSIRVATLLGCLIAFAFLFCVFSTQAEAASRVDRASPAALADNLSSTAEADRPHGALIQLPQSAGDGAASADNLQDDESSKPTWSLALGLALAMSLTVGVAVALVGASRSRSAMRRVMGQHQRIADQWARRYEAAAARERSANVAAWDSQATQGEAGAFDAEPASAPSIATNAPYEPFDHRFLDSLSDEGLDLSVFLAGWRRAMNDDLTRLGVLSRQRDTDHLRGVLHRLSGAVGLVGARSLMEALRRASALPLKQDVHSIDVLIARAKNLVMQLDARAVVLGGNAK